MNESFGAAVDGDLICHSWVLKTKGNNSQTHKIKKKCYHPRRGNIVH